MQSEIMLSPLRVMDSQRLRSAGICTGKLQDISDMIRDKFSDPRAALYMASFSEDADRNPLALLIFDQIHPVHKNTFVELHFASSLPVEETAVTAISDATESVSSDSEHRLPTIKHKVVDAMLRLAFFTMHLHRVSVVISVFEHTFADVLLDCGMVQEAVLDEALCLDGVFRDAGLFSLLASEYPDYGVAFVAYQQGVLSIKGGKLYVEGIHFYQYEEEILDPYERVVAIRIGVADSSGILKRCGDPSFQNGCTACPNEIAKAARELKEYFSKARTSFSAKIRFPFGSDFQRHVWAELQRIPYGSTVSYEDVAMSLTGNDRVAARNLSRAVGSACAENPIPILVPCHRVIGKNGRLVGFSGGVAIKEFLLEHEIFGFFRDIPKNN